MSVIVFGRKISVHTFFVGDTGHWLISKALSTLIRFQPKTKLFCSVFKKICVHTYRFRIVFARPRYNAVSVLNAFILSVRMLKWTRRMRFLIYRPTKLKPHGSVRPPFWILTVEWSLMTSPFSDIIVFSVHTKKKHRFQIAPLWRAFSNGSVFGDRFRRCSVDDRRNPSNTAPFSFENGLVWTGP